MRINKSKYISIKEYSIEKKIFLICLLFSIFAHLISLPFVKMNLISSSNLPVTEKESRIRLILPPKVSKKSLQIAETIKSKNHKKAKDSLFLSKNNNTFDKQTVAKKIGRFAKLKRGHIAEHKQNKILEKMTLNNLGFNNPQVKITKIIKDNPSEKAQLGASNDYIEDIPLGDMTKLNTTEYKYYGFYHRIKQKLEQHWGKSVQEKMNELYRKKGRVPASVTKVTSLLVRIDKMGNIKNILLKGSSGINELDQAAIESFNKAGPFPNPPNGMLKNGLAQIEWGFVLKG